jgi:hypothetical protein
LVKENEIESIESNEFYTRKHVIKSAEIEDFINDRFPIFNKDSHGFITLIKGKSWREACDLAVNEVRNGAIPQSSWYRDENLTYSLIQMDKLRARLIRNSKMKVVFYTNLSNEFYIAEKKFKLFCDTNN